MCGMYGEAIQKKLLADKTLTFEMALSVTQGSELATKTPDTLITVKQEPVDKVADGK